MIENTYGYYLDHLIKKYSILIKDISAITYIEKSSFFRLRNGERFPSHETAKLIDLALKKYCKPQERWRLLALGGFLPDDWNIAHELVSLVYNSTASKDQKNEFMLEVAKLGAEFLVDLVKQDWESTKILNTVEASKIKGTARTRSARWDKERKG